MDLGSHAAPCGSPCVPRAVPPAAQEAVEAADAAQALCKLRANLGMIVPVEALFYLDVAKRASARACRPALAATPSDGGAFGQWIDADSSGMPAFDYTLDQTSAAGAAIARAYHDAERQADWRNATDNLFELGNARFVVVASTLPSPRPYTIHERIDIVTTVHAPDALPIMMSRRSVYQRGGRRRRSVAGV